MIHAGVCSVTFRKLVPEQIVELAAEAGLAGIEWGGDVHVPPSDLAHAEYVQRITREKGLRISSYGSYYRLVESEQQGQPFEWVLETALALGAPTIRVWAGGKGSAEADDSYRRRVAQETERIADLAAEEGLSLSFEFHAHTLTDTDESAEALLRAVDRSNVSTYFQPRFTDPVATNLNGLERILPWLRHLHVHVFSRADEKREQRPLAEGKEEWLQYLGRVAATSGERFALLEFVRGGEQEQFRQDAATLREWVCEVETAAR